MCAPAIVSSTFPSTLKWRTVRWRKSKTADSPMTFNGDHHHVHEKSDGAQGRIETRVPFGRNVAVRKKILLMNKLIGFARQTKIKHRIFKYIIVTSWQNRSQTWCWLIAHRILLSKLVDQVRHGSGHCENKGSVSLPVLGGGPPPSVWSPHVLGVGELSSSSHDLD